MKVAVYEGVKSIKLEERPMLRAGSGEVIVKVKYCGICGSDVHSYLSNEQWPAGIVLGHESVGTVAEIGSGVDGWTVGDRVAVMPFGSCGECHFCKTGRFNLCPHCFERAIGISKGNDGGFAEYVRVRKPGFMLYRLPDGLSFEDAVLAEPVAVGIAAVRQSDFRFGDRVAVVGTGVIGLALVQLLRMGGARRITAINRSAMRRELALEFGADVAYSPLIEGAALAAKVKAAHDGLGVDVVFECAGTIDSFMTALSLVICDGQVLLIGGGSKPLPMTEHDLVFRQIGMKAIQAYSEEYAMALDIMAQGRINTKPMLTAIVSLDDIVEKGLERLASSGDAVKIVVAP